MAPLRSAVLCALGLATCALGSSQLCGAEGDAECVSEDVGLLQTHAAATEVSSDEPSRGHFVINMRGEEKSAGSEACSPGIQVRVSNPSIPSNAALTYDFPGLSGSCSEPNAFGPSSCCDEWGADAKLDYKLKYSETPTTAWKAHVKAEISAYIVFGYVHVGTVEIDCPICGAACTIPEISLAHVVTIASQTVDMPACPTEPQLEGDLTLMLPEGVNVPVKVKATAEVKLFDATGKVAASATLDAAMHPPR